MNKALFWLLVLSLLANLLLVAKAYDYRRKMILAWAQSHDWVMEYQTGPWMPSKEKRATTLAFIGSSITAHWDLAKYFPDAPFFNLGIDGQYSGQLLLRFKHDVLDRRPGGVVIKLCEMNFNPQVPFEISCDNMIMMATLAHVFGIKPYIATTLPIGHRAAGTKKVEIVNERIQKFNSWVRAWVLEHGYTLVDIARPLTGELGELPDSCSYDGVHPNEQGYKIMSAVMAKVITGEEK
jgi:hypothetical protein